MRILILSQHYWPETFRINEVAQSLSELGCEVTVMTGKPNYPDGKVFEGYRAWGTGRERHAQVNVVRVPLIPRGGGTALRLVANYLSFIFSATLLGPWVLRRTRFDAILVYGTSPILQAIPAVLLKRLRGMPLVTWVQDLWPESLEATGFVRNRRVLAAVAAVVRWIYRRNDLLLVQSHAFEPAVRALAPATPVAYQPNPGELAFSRSMAPGPAALTLKPGFNLVFAGNLGTVQALDTVLQAARLLQPHPTIRIVLIGSGGRAEWLRQQVAKEGLGNVELPGRFPPAAMPGILAQASAVLVSLVKSPIMELTVPSKVQAYMAAGCPIVASLDGEGARVVLEAGAGLACPAEDAAALASAVLQLAGMSAEQRHRLGAAGRRYYAQHFEPATLARRLIDHLRGAADARVAHLKVSPPGNPPA